MIYFVRHGETDYNKQGRMQGWLDIPLNANGIMQADKASEVLKDYNFDVIYCSPLSRAYKTAQIINKHHNVPIITDDRLKEYNVGNKQGKLFKEEKEKVFSNGITNPKEYGAETHSEFSARVMSAVKDIQATNKNVLIVSHGGVYVAIFKYVNGISADANVPPLKNCEVYQIPKLCFEVEKDL